MHNARSGAALIEVVVALGVLVTFASAYAQLTVGSYDGTRQSRQQSIAARFAQEGIEALRSIAKRDFDLLTNGTHGVDTDTAMYTLSGSNNVSGKYTRTLQIAAVNRNAGDHIVSSGGTEDEDTKAITSAVTWSVADNRSNTVSFFTYLTNWAVSATEWTIDTLSEFQAGFINSTIRTSNGDGEARLRPMGDMTDPSIYLTEDLNGTANPTEILIDPIEDRLYMTTTSNGGGADVWIYDISDVSNAILTITGSLEIGNTSNGLAFGDGYLYALSNAGNEIRVFDLSDLSTVANWNIPSGSNPRAIAIDTELDQLYVVTEDSGSEEFYILDISNPESASIVIADDAEIGQTGFDLALYRNSHVFIGTAGNASELLIVPLSNPSSFSTCNLSGNQDVVSLHIEENRLFVGEESGGTEFTEYTIDPLDPTNCSPASPGSINVSGDVLAIDVDTSRNEAYITTDDSELQVIDLDTYTASTIATGSDCDAVEFYGAYVYIGCDNNTNTFRIIRGGQGGWSALSQVGDASTPGNDNANAVYVSGDYVYVGTNADSNDDELFIYDISGGATTGMSEVGSVEIGSTINDVFVLGNYAYLGVNANAGEFVIVDISTPASPSVTGSLNVDDDVYGVYVSGTTAYLSTDSNGGDEFFVVNVAVPAAPVELDGYNVGADANSVWVSGNYAYLATDQNSQELLVLDVSIPASVSFADALNTSSNSNGENIWIEGSTAYLVTQDDFYTIDISTPTNVSQLDTLDFGNGNEGVTVNATENLAFVSTRENGAEVRVVDVTDPSNISLVTTVNLTGSDDSNDIIADDTYVYTVSDRNAEELRILGQGEMSSELPHHGSVTSPVFDSENASASWQQISWVNSGSGSTTMRVRTGDSLANVLQARFVGSDGTANTVYSQSGGQAITVDPSATGTQFMQWKAYFSGSGAETPILEDVTLSFQ